MLTSSLVKYFHRQRRVFLRAPDSSECVQVIQEVLMGLHSALKSKIGPSNSGFVFGRFAIDRANDDGYVNCSEQIGEHIPHLQMNLL